MSNQSGKLALVLVILVAVLLILYLSFSRFSPQAPYINEGPESSSVVDTSLDVENSRCSDLNYVMMGEVWDLLPSSIKDRTYRKGVNEVASSTYELELLKGSSECRYIPVVVELIGRDGNIYSEEDYKNRSIFIFDEKEKRLSKVMDIPADMLLDSQAYASDLWEGNNIYKFVLSETEKQGKFVKVRYQYDVNSGETKKEVVQD